MRFVAEITACSKQWESGSGNRNAVWTNALYHWLHRLKGQLWNYVELKLFSAFKQSCCIEEITILQRSLARVLFNLPPHTHTFPWGRMFSGSTIHMTELHISPHRLIEGKPRGNPLSSPHFMWGCLPDIPIYYTELKFSNLYKKNIS